MSDAPLFAPASAADPGGRPRPHRPAAPAWACLALLALSACQEAPAPPVRHGALPTRPAMVTLATLGPVDASRRPGLAPSVPRSQARRDVEQFALNVLLLPLFDDDQPTRWADPSLAFDCDAADVRIDGRRPDVGAPVPREPFTVRWAMRGCQPLDTYVQMSGDVELRVEPVAGGYRARVLPHPLQVTSTSGVETLSEPFDARLSVGP
ncbi:MAG: hypothetical protein ABIX46_02945 [Burkholderiaceae bacterium]